MTQVVGMDRREFIRLSAGAAALGAFGVLSTSTAEHVKKPLNVVLIMADDLGYECLGAYGSRQYETPRLDQMAAGGVRFTNCYSAPLCTPSRVKIMTGQDNVRNYADFGQYPKGQVNFAQMVKARGYTTGFAGKWQLEGQGLFPKDVGFDDVCLLLGQWPEYWETPLAINDVALPVDKSLYGPDRITQYATDFVRKKRDRPFCLYYPMTLVHGMIEAAPALRGTGKAGRQRQYESMVAHMDTCVGRILDALKDAGVADNTVVLFTGDNGTDGSLYSTLDDKVIRGGKGHTRDHGTHVPLLVTGAGVPAGHVCEDLIDFSDFMPTIAAITAAALPTDRTLDGRSFWPQCQGRAGTPREWLFNYYYPRPYEMPYDDKYRHSEVRWVRNRRYKLYGDGRLFDTVEDVLEKSPVRKGTLPALRTRLQAILDRMPSQGAGIDYSRVEHVANELHKRNRKKAD